MRAYWQWFEKWNMQTYLGGIPNEFIFHWYFITVIYHLSRKIAWILLTLAIVSTNACRFVKCIKRECKLSWHDDSFSIFRTINLWAAKVKNMGCNEMLTFFSVGGIFMAEPKIHVPRTEEKNKTWDKCV